MKTRFVIQLKRLLCAVMWKVLPAIVAVTSGWRLAEDNARAQSSGPSSLAAQRLSVTVQSGSPPFAASGDFKLFMSPLGSNFVILGNPEAELS